jgi:hypothetical protein
MDFALLVMVGFLLPGMGSDAGASPSVLEAEVLEGSGSLDVTGTRAAPVRYALIHHAREQDQAAFAEWLRSHKSAEVSFITKDGTPHHGILSRLKYCFGRGLLIYADPVGLAEKDLVQLELPMSDMRP